MSESLLSKAIIFLNSLLFANQLGFSITDGQHTAQLHQLVMLPDFQTAFQAEFGLNAEMTKAIVSEIEHLYNYDYSGIFGYLYYGVKWGIYPCLIFLCIGATTDFGH